MSPIYEPIATKTQGADKITFMTTVADPAAPSLATEVNATSSVEGTLAMYGSWDAPVNVNTGNAPTRVGTTVQLPQEGNAQRQVIPVAYPVDPSADKTDPNNKLWALLAEGAEVYVFVRRGVDKDTDFAVGDRGYVYRCVAGFQPEPSRTGDDEFAEYQVAQNLVPVAEPVEATLAA
jgi:hypothetical protein